jgi:hypothetical protein
MQFIYGMPVAWSVIEAFQGVALEMGTEIPVQLEAITIGSVRY